MVILPILIGMRNGILQLLLKKSQKVLLFGAKCGILFMLFIMKMERDLFKKTLF